MIITTLIWVGALFLVFQASIALSFLISCIWEKEGRASFFAAIQLLSILVFIVFFFYLKAINFFVSTTGASLLIAGFVVTCGAVFLLVRRTAPNLKALQGTKGLIVGKVERFDERTQVFARNRSIPPGLEQYRKFYDDHPELEEL